MKEILTDALAAEGKALAPISRFPDSLAADVEGAVGSRAARLLYLRGEESSAYLLLPAELVSADSLRGALGNGAATVTELFPEIDYPLGLEYLLSRREVGEVFSVVETGGGASASDGDASLGTALVLPTADRKRTPSTDIPADLMAGRGLLDEGILEAATGRSWLLVRCERIGLVGEQDLRKLVETPPEKPRYYETGGSGQFGAEELSTLGEESRRRFADSVGSALPRGSADAEADRRYALFLFRGSRGGAVGSLKSGRLLFVVPLSVAVPPQEQLRRLVGDLLRGHLETDPEAGLSWLRLLAPRRYQFLKPSAAARHLYGGIVAGAGKQGETQRLFAALRRDRTAFGAFGRLLAAAPAFHTAPVLGRLSPEQRELLLPPPGAVSGELRDRLPAVIEALREIEVYALQNPTSAARPTVDLLDRLGRERLRRTGRLVQSSVQAGVFSALFEHARLGWLQRAWSRIDRREMVRALALEPPRVIERAGMLYSRRGRELLKEDAAAVARRAKEWDPPEMARIGEARRRLWKVLVDQLFDGESGERYATVLGDTAAGGGLPGAIAALHLLRLGYVRPSVVPSQLKLQAAARVAAEPALDEHSVELLSGLAEEPRLLRRGGSRFAWLLAHALERMGRPESGAAVLEAVIEQIRRGSEELSPEEVRRARRLAGKYQDLTR